MEIGTGYKNTEVGVIPEDWEVKNLGEVSDIKTGPFGSSLHEKDYVIDGTPIITVEHLGELGILHDNMPMVSDFDRKRLMAYAMQTNDIVFSRVGSVDRNSIVGEKENGWLFSGRLLRIRINSKNVFPKYLSYHFHQETFKQRIRSVAVGQTMASLNTQILKGINVVLPPTKAEQITIANILSDTDALIYSLEKLIAKKHNIKQGAMQKLLQPKEGWEVKKLGEVIYLQGGYAFKSELFTHVGIPIIRISDVENNTVNTEDSVCYEPFNIPKEFIAKKGDVLIAMSGATTGKIGVYDNAGIAYINQRVGKFTVLNESKTSQEFISHIVRSEKFKENLVKEIAQGAQPNISGKQIQSIILPIPNDKEEQIYIATILSDMDNEITAFEAKLEKYRKVKSGMMQNLLTGKIRLI